MEEARKFIEGTVKMLVTKPDAVSLEIGQDEGGVLVGLSVSKEDMGIVIGKEGKTIMAIRTLTRCIGAKEKATVRIKLIEPPSACLNDTSGKIHLMI